MGVIKAKREAVPEKPTLARAEIVDKPTRRRFETELDAALKRRSPGEAKLAGARSRDGRRGGRSGPQRSVLLARSGAS
jgi:hypothetical protein